MAQIPIHPAIVHFPIALVVVGALAELVHLLVRKQWIRWMGPVLLTIALMGAVGAYFTGQAAEDAVEEQGVPDDAVDAHEQAGIFALGAIALAALLAWATRPKNRGLHIAAIVAVVAAGITLFAAFRGGELVYVHGAGRLTQTGETTVPVPGQGAERGGDFAEHDEEREH